MVGTLIKASTGRWVVQYVEGFYPYFYRYLFPVDPDQEVIEENISDWDNLVAFSTRYFANEVYAFIEDDCN